MNGAREFLQNFRDISYLTWTTVEGLGKERTQPIGHYFSELESILFQPGTPGGPTRSRKLTLCQSMVCCQY